MDQVEPGWILGVMLGALVIGGLAVRTFGRFVDSYDDRTRAYHARNRILEGTRSQEEE